MRVWEEVTTAAIYAVFAAGGLAAFYWLKGGDEGDVFADYVIVGGGMLGIVVVCYVIRGLMRALGGLLAPADEKEFTLPSGTAANPGSSPSSRGRGSLGEARQERRL
ncbi:MAG: hypothetical protein ACHQAY_15305 [Hyphomicrobiales bacterium]